MKQFRIVWSLLLALALTLSLSVCALAEGDAEITVEETKASMKVICADAAGKTLRDDPADYLDLDKDLTLDAAYPRPEIAGYTYSRTTLDGQELEKLSISHDPEGKVQIRAELRSGDIIQEKTLGGEETLVFVYEQKEEEHTHAWDEGKVTKEASCTEKGEKTFTCSCGETKTEEIPALGHDWGEVSCSWAGDNSACSASRVCKRDASHTESESVKPTEKTNKEPTCTEKGEKTLSAVFTNSAFAAQSKTVEIPALGHDYAHGRCKRCDGIDPNFKPKLSDDTNGRANWGSDYLVVSDAARKDFQKVLIDGKELPSSDYTVTEKNGNTLVSVKGSAIKNLKVGEHKIAVVSATGTAERKFNVSDKPKTGDESPAPWLMTLGLSFLGLGAASFVLERKYRAA